MQELTRTFVLAALTRCLTRFCIYISLSLSLFLSPQARARVQQARVQVRRAHRSFVRVVRRVVRFVRRSFGRRRG